MVCATYPLRRKDVRYPLRVGIAFLDLVRLEDGVGRPGSVVDVEASIFPVNGREPKW
jgi:hypothetical protein